MFRECRTAARVSHWCFALFRGSVAARGSVAGLSRVCRGCRVCRGVSRMFHRFRGGSHRGYRVSRGCFA
eukprot:4503168-Prymnesium_polylepis.1